MVIRRSKALLIRVKVTSSGVTPCGKVMISVPLAPNSVKTSVPPPYTYVSLPASPIAENSRRCRQ